MPYDGIVGWCNYCTEQKTVPWLPARCNECGNDIIEDFAQRVFKSRVPDSDIQFRGGVGQGKGRSGPNG